MSDPNNVRSREENNVRMFIKTLFIQAFGKGRPGDPGVLAEFLHQEIALLTGAARQTVTTTLNELRDEGLIDFSRRELVVHQMEKLATIAK